MFPPDCRQIFATIRLPKQNLIIFRERASLGIFKGRAKRFLQLPEGIQNILLSLGEGIVTSVLSAKSHTTVKVLFTFHF
jgi:hypothetical protein